MPRLDDSKPFSTEQMEQPVFSPELQSEKLTQLQTLAVNMQNVLNVRVKHCGHMAIDDLWEGIFGYTEVMAYLLVAGDRIGRPFVKTAFSMAIRNYINSKE